MHRVSWLLDNWSQSEGFLVASGEFYSTTQVWVGRCGWAGEGEQLWVGSHLCNALPHL